MKKILALVLAAAMLFPLMSACTSEKAPQPDATAAPVAKTADQPADPAAAKTDTSWPEKTVTIIVPFGGGGDSDYNGRILAKYLEAELGATFVVENMKGSGGTIGSTSVKDADPDGYVVLQNHNALMISQASGISDFGLDAFELVGITAANPGDVIAVSSQTGITDLESLIVASNENKMTVATNIGATTQVSSFMLGEYANVTQVDVGGIADKVAALLGGQVDIIIGPYGNIAPYVESGDMTILGVTAKERAELFPEIPTCIEQGYEIYFPTRFFYAFPKGTDQAIVDKFAAALEKIITTNEDYAKEIAEAYYQTPLWIPADEAVAVYDEISELISRYSLTSLG